MASALEYYTNALMTIESPEPESPASANVALSTHELLEEACDDLEYLAVEALRSSSDVLVSNRTEEQEDNLQMPIFLHTKIYNKCINLNRSNLTIQAEKRAGLPTKVRHVAVTVSNDELNVMLRILPSLYRVEFLVNDEKVIDTAIRERVWQKAINVIDQLRAWVDRQKLEGIDKGRRVRELSEDAKERGLDLLED